MFLYSTRCMKICKQVKSVYLRNYCALKVMQENEQPLHIPVMKEEVIENLNVKDGDTVLDMTFGGGGHSKSLLERYPNIKIIALDRDPLANGYAKELQEKLPNQIIPLLGKFSELVELFQENGISSDQVDAVLFDLGASSMQMDSDERGFGVSRTSPLDMRMDGDRYPDSITAADVINYASEDDLYKIFKIYGEEKHSRLIARSITQARYTYQNFKTTTDLADLVNLVCTGPRLDMLQRKAHGATKIFQALRIFVNNELNEFNYGLMLANRYLKKGGRVVVLSFHSLEDTIAKMHFRGHIFDNSPCPPKGGLRSHIYNMDKALSAYSKNPWRAIHKNVIVPTKEEVSLNPRSRSAKLRAAEKIGSIVY